MTEGTIVGRIMVVIHTVIQEGGPRMTRGMSIEMEVDVVGVIGEFIDFDARILTFALSVFIQNCN